MNLCRILPAVLCAAGATGLANAQDMKPQAVTAVPFTAVKFADEFWSPRLETNRRVTIPFAFKKCEETGRIDNFAKAGGLMPGKHIGERYNDSDVFKVIEGAAYSLTVQPDPQLDQYLDDLIAKIAAAQEPDGYLYTIRRLNPDNPPDGCGATRWSYLAQSHELYNVGHLYEAAVAHFQATGKRTLLDVALKSADLVAREFGPHARHGVPGHQEIEIGLAKLYRLTGERRYLDLAKFFLDERGYAHDRELYGEYAQDHQPVLEQEHPVGHAVRAAYMYCGMADVATLTGDERYIGAIDRIWRSMVSRRMYVTGGIGARGGEEAFGDDYELPNATAYCETCAAIANAMWNQRMFLLHRDAKYVDVLERVLYNGFLSGVSLSGDLFFYVNPLASDGKAKRQAWFDCSCCPSNVVRFLPSIPGYVYAAGDRAVYVNLFVAGSGKIPLGEQTVTLTQAARYPWDGDVQMTVTPEKPAEFTLYVRIPGWASDQAVPSDLYRFLDKPEVQPTLRVNDAAVPLDIERGYARVQRTWQAGDRVELALPMAVRRVVADPAVKDNVNRVALQRGPIMYCVEAVDNGGQVADLVLPDDAALRAEPAPALLGGVTVLRGTATRGGAPVELVAVPYYAWCHREIGAMRVWLPRVP